jgi:hypothetical protein
MQYIDRPPRWLRKKSKTVVTLNEYNGRPTQALIDQKAGAVALWRVQGFAPAEPQVHVFVHLSDDEAQDVYDADRTGDGLLNPVWNKILDNRVVVSVEERDRPPMSFGILMPRAYDQEQFVDAVLREAATFRRAKRRSQSESAAHRVLKEQGQRSSSKDIQVVVDGLSGRRLISRHALRMKKPPVKSTNYGKMDFLEIYNSSAKSTNKSFDILSK